MEDKSFTVKEAARILGCSRWTVRRLLNNGWISVPVGRPKNRGNVRISEKSVFQFILYDRLNDLPRRYCRDWKHGRKRSRDFWCKRETLFVLVRMRGQREPEGLQTHPGRTTPPPTPSRKWRGDNSGCITILSRSTNSVLDGVRGNWRRTIRRCRTIWFRRCLWQCWSMTNRRALNICSNWPEIARSTTCGTKRRAAGCR